MKHSRPIIAVTGPEKGGLAAWLMCSAAVFLAGGRTVRLTPASRNRTAQPEGLIISGGADIDPSRYDVEVKDELKDMVAVQKRSKRKIVHAVIYEKQNLNTPFCKRG